MGSAFVGGQRLALVFLAWLGSAAAAADCDPAEKMTGDGPFAVEFFNETLNGTIFYGWLPVSNAPAPVVAFMHGSTGQWGFYSENLRIYASHGLAVVFPFIESPEGDEHWWVTNTDGAYLKKAVAFALEGPFRARVDAARVAVAGHSMGATCAIAAGAAAGPGAYRLVVAQHPGICGPFGPPPWPATWMPSDMRSLTSKFPLLMTTATNDGAFLPAPHTAPHEHGCYEKGANGTAAFVQFSEAACADDGAREPLVDDGGHDCPMKIGAPESPWVLVALKLYLLLDGDAASTCHELLYGNATASLRKSPDADLVDIRGA